jgi:hypothetical protein
VRFSFLVSEEIISKFFFVFKTGQFFKAFLIEDSLMPKNFSKELMLIGESCSYLAANIDTKSSLILLVLNPSICVMGIATGLVLVTFGCNLKTILDKEKRQIFLLLICP